MHGRPAIGAATASALLEGARLVVSKAGEAIAAASREDAVAADAAANLTMNASNEVTGTAMNRQRNRASAFAAILISIVLMGGARLGMAASREPRGQAFTSTQAAAQSFVQAMRAGDDDALVKILGPEAKTLVSSGDPVADAAVKKKIVAAYDQMHRFVTTSDGRVFLYLGAENWPLPIPLIHRKGKWYFDTAFGKQEILARRIGKNELDAIQVCEAIVAAQQQYMSRVQTGQDGAQYAQKILSDDGRHDGLFWKTAPGEPASPLGPLVASASAQGYRRAGGGKPTPYHGYIYEILKEQGPHAPGGAHSYLQDGKMTRGFAVIAYPAVYRSSGVMTFIAGQDGAVYQKDLGPKTGTIAPSIKSYDPDDTWERVPPEDEQQTAPT